MSRCMSVILLLLGSTFLLLGCGGGKGPAAPGVGVTLHVPDMTERQGLT